jgi:hypothetical protein
MFDALILRYMERRIESKIVYKKTGTNIANLVPCMPLD